MWVQSQAITLLISIIRPCFCGPLITEISPCLALDYSLLYLCLVLYHAYKSDQLCPFEIP